MSRDMWLVLGGIAVGAIGASYLIKNKQKVKPMAAEIMAKAITLKEKAVDYAAQAKEHAEDIAAEAKHIKETSQANA